MTYAIDTAELVVLRASGLTIVEVARRANMSRGAVRRRLRIYGKPRRGPSERCQQVVAAYREHGTLNKTAAALGINRVTVLRTVRRYEKLTGESVPRYRGRPRA